MMLTAVTVRAVLILTVMAIAMLVIVIAMAPTVNSRP